MQQFYLRTLRKFENRQSDSTRFWSFPQRFWSFPHFLKMKWCWNSGKCSSKLVNFGQQLQNISEVWQQTIKMRKCLTNLSWLFEFGAVHCCGLLVSSPGPCASSGWRLSEALFLVLRLDSNGAKVCTSCRSRQELSHEYLDYLLAKIGFDTAEKWPVKVCQKSPES